MSGEDPAALRVDVVVDNFNYARYLAAAVRSALAQTHPATRVIVVDDGSSDDSRDVLREFEDRVEVVLKDNGGQASALNAGLARCQGDVVIFLDADDVLHPEAAARAAAALATDPGAVRASLRMDVIDAAGAATGELKPPGGVAIPAGDLRHAALAYPFDLPWLPTSGNAFRRSLLVPILPIPEAPYRIGADWHLVHLSMLLGTVIAVDLPSSSYRVHGANSYERSGEEVDLAQVRKTIACASSAAAGLLELADRLDIPAPRRILSVSDLGQRMISLRLDPARHPVPGDSRRRLLRGSLTALKRRDNASVGLRLAFVVWFVLMALVPKSIAHRLAAWFLVPSTRPGTRKTSGWLRT